MNQSLTMTDTITKRVSSAVTSTKTIPAMNAAENRNAAYLKSTGIC